MSPYESSARQHIRKRAWDKHANPGQRRVDAIPPPLCVARNIKLCIAAAPFGVTRKAAAKVLKVSASCCACVALARQTPRGLAGTLRPRGEGVTQLRKPPALDLLAANSRASLIAGRAWRRDAWSSSSSSSSSSSHKGSQTQEQSFVNHQSRLLTMMRSVDA
jgi:hypothetical protein